VCVHFPSKTLNSGVYKCFLRQALESLGVTFMPVLLNSKVEEKKKHRSPQEDKETRMKLYLI
jgi:hypothetical protein